MVVGMRPVAVMLTAGAFIGLTHSVAAGANESRCARMLKGAPERIHRLEAVQSCDHADAGCAYVEGTAGYGVLTLICPRVVHVIFADRLEALRFRDGAWSGECRGSSWQLGPGLPGCYPNAP